MKNRGYTLIELIAVISIILILLGGGFTVINMLDSIKRQVELEDAVYEVNSILSYAKAHCRKNYSGGSVVIDTVNNTIAFKARDENNVSVYIKKDVLPSSVKITAPTIEGSLIDVSNKGYLNKAGTILITSKNETRKISISVGNDHIWIKDDEKVNGNKKIKDEEIMDETEQN